jgi:hypothetical protein
MSRLFATLLLTSLVAVPACKKKNGATGSGSATAEKTASGGAATGCPAGAYSNPDGGFCLQMPAGGKFDKFDPQSDDGKLFYFVAASDGAPLFDITTYPKKAFADELASVKVDAKGLGDQKPLQSGDLPGGGFYHAVSYQSNGATENKVVSLIQHGTGAIECDGEADDKGLQALLDACKSVRSL